MEELCNDCEDSDEEEEEEVGSEVAVLVRRGSSAIIGAREAPDVASDATAPTIDDAIAVEESIEFEVAGAVS